MTAAPKKKDLRSSAPLWEDSSRRRVRVRSRLKAETCDVAIVGAGISGAIAAAVLTIAGHDVTVIDRRLPGQGSTLASTAMILFEIDTPLSELAEKIGGKSAERAYLRSYRAVAALGELIRSQDLSCAWKERDALLLTGDEMGQRAMAAEAAYRAKIGLPSQFLKGVEVRARYGFDRTGAIVSRGSAELNPVQLAAECLRVAQRNGARIYAPHDVTEIHASSRQVVLATAEGATVTARRALIATGYETLKQIPADDYELVATWAIATRPLPPERFWPTRCLVWEAADPYLYVRATEDNRIIAGGEDGAFDSPERRDRLLAKKSKAVLEKLRGLLGDKALEIEYAWAGTFADSPTGLPFISEVAGLPNCLGLLGCGGNGITFAMVAAEIARRWAAGRPDPDADLFRLAD